MQFRRMLSLMAGLLVPLGLSAQQTTWPTPNATPLYDNSTPSNGIGFTLNTDVQLPPCAYTVPAGLLQNPKDKIRWWAAGNAISSTDVKTITGRYAAIAGTGSSGITLGGETASAVSSLSWFMQGIISKVSTNSQRVSSTGTIQGNGNNGLTLSGAGNAQDNLANLIVIAGKSANASPPNDSVICNEFHVWFEPGAPLP